jgi:imidazolonepropionase-like amidohydrolase
MAKLSDVAGAGTRSLEIATRAGLKLAYGTDISRSPELQSDEFLLRAEVLKPVDIIRSATLIGAEVVRREGELGIIAPGAIADLLVVDGNPLEDLKTLTDQGACMPIIMKDGALVKNTLES